jgi:hypothetical protein
MRKTPLPQIAVSAVLGLTSCGALLAAVVEGPHAFASPSRSADPNTHDAAPNPEPPKIAVPDLIEHLDDAKYAQIYGGLRAVHDGESFVIYLARPSKDAERDFTKVAMGLPMRFESTPESQKSLNALESRVTDAMPGLAKSGIHITSSWTDISKGIVSINVVHLAMGDRDIIRSAVGSTRLRISNVDTFESGVTRTPLTAGRAPQAS